jgi:Golgi nucleoside diphosphatase
MERMLATPADAEIILGLYQLRTEALMRQARAWVTGEFWPATAEEFFAVAENPADPHNAWLRQVLTYWEMAAAMVLHGAVSAELFVDCNSEGFYLFAKFSSILEGIRAKNPEFMIKTAELVRRFSAAAQRYEAMLKNVETQRNRLAARQEANGSFQPKP